MFIDKPILSDSLALEVRGQDGMIKDIRYIKKGKEFIANKLYLKLINKGSIKSNTWKVPFLFGRWQPVKTQ